MEVTAAKYAVGKQIVICSVLAILCHLLEKRERVPRYTNFLAGATFTLDLLYSESDRIFHYSRMPQDVFIRLHNWLVENTDIQEGRRITVPEKMFIFCEIVCQNSSYRRAAEQFQHSIGTISR